MDKPISLILEEAKIDYVEAINKITKKHQLNMYFVDMIMNAIYREINNVRNQELQQEIAEYEKSQKKDAKK